MTDTVRESSSGKGEVAEPRWQRDERRIRQLMKQCGHEHSLSLMRAFKQIVQEVRMEALSTPDRARVEVLEEAAGVAECQFDERPTGCGIDWTDGYERACRDVARTIRALAHGEGPVGG